MGRALGVRMVFLAATIAAVALTTSTIGAEPLAVGQSPVDQRTAEQGAADDRGRPAELSRLLGVWRGTYICAQGMTGLTLTISGNTAETLEAEFAFYAVPQNPLVPSGRFRMSGGFDPAARTLELRPGQWIQRPLPYVTVGLNTSVDFDAGEMVGTVSGPGCGPVRLTQGQPVALLRAQQHG